MSNHSSIVTQIANTAQAAANQIMPVQEQSQNEPEKQLLQKKIIQFKLTIGSSDDPLEHEADKMADTVIRMPEQNFIQRKCSHCEEEKMQRKPLASFIQRKESSSGAVASDTITSQINSSRGNGSNMDRPTQSFMESRFGTDFSDVKIHTGNESVQMNRELNAKAFTVGNDIYFNEGQYKPNSNEGKHLLAHELTHTVQHGTGKSIQQKPGSISHNRISNPVIQRFVPDDEKLLPSHTSKVLAKNFEHWYTYQLTDIMPLRDITPETSEIAYTNRTWEAQKLIRKAGILINGKNIGVDGILGPEAIYFLNLIATTDSYKDLRFKIAGLGFDMISLASPKAASVTRQSLVDISKLKFLHEWNLKAAGDIVIEHLTVSKEEPDLAKAIIWYDTILFGGTASQKLVSDGFTLGDRHAILKKVYEGVAFTGRVALVKAKRDFLDVTADTKKMVMKDPGKPADDPLRVSFSADFENYAAKIEKWFGITYPNQKAEKVRKSIGPAMKDNIPEVTGLLLSFYLPIITPAERIRLDIIRDQYLQDKAENIDNFIQPRMLKLISLINDDETSRYLIPHLFEEALLDFAGRPLVFEKLATLLESNTDKNYFEALLKRVKQLGRVSVLQLLVQLCNQTRFKNYSSVIEALTFLQDMKHNVQSHDYVAGTPDQQGVWINKGRGQNDFFKVGDVTTGLYRISETKERIKEAKRVQLKARMEELIEQRTRDAMDETKVSSKPDMTEDKFMESILEQAAQDVKITKDDIEEVQYEQAFRIKGVQSKMIHGVEEFSVNYERVARLGGLSGTWEVTQPSSGYESRFDFEEALGWYKFYHTMKGVEQLILIEAGVFAVVGGVIFLAAGGGAALIALGGGAKMVGISIGISVLIYAISNRHNLTVEGFIKAVVEGYLMAVGLKLFAPLGASAAKFIGTATFRQKMLGLLLQSVITGGGSGAFTGAGSLLAMDILAGKLHSPGDYLKAASFGFLMGAMFELGGSLLIGPIFKTAGKSVLQRITNIELLKEFFTKNSIALKPGQWGPEITNSFSGFVTWMRENLEGKLISELAKDAKTKAASILTSFAEGFELTVHRQALDLIEGGMTKQSVEALEILISATHKKLGKTASRELLDDVLNKLVASPKRANPFFGIVKAADSDLLAILMQGKNLNNLATSEGILSLTLLRKPDQVANLLKLHFDDHVNNCESWAGGLLAQKGDVQIKILDLLESHSGSVTPESLLRIAQSGTALSDEVVTGLTRMITNARMTGIKPSSIETMLHYIDNDKMQAFVTSVGQLAKDDFDDIMRLTSKPEQAGKLLNYANNTDQLLNILKLGGKNADEIELLFLTTKGKGKFPVEIESLMNRYSGNTTRVRELIKQLDGDAALLERSMARLNKKDVEEIMAKGLVQPVTRNSPASMRRLLEMSEKNGWTDASKIKGFIERLHANQAQPFKHTFENALDRLQDFVTHHTRSTAPPPALPGHGPLNLAGPGTLAEITLSAGNKVTLHANANNLQHYHEGHTFENFWFDPAKIDRAGVSTFWPPRSSDKVILKDLMDVFGTGDCKLMVERDLASGYAKSPPLIDTGGTKFQIGTDVSAANSGTTMFFPKEGTRAIPVSKHILHAVKDLLGL